jgi:sigma-B regulation protein RsbU (phosphoserine phosphatase)
MTDNSGGRRKRAPIDLARLAIGLAIVVVAGGGAVMMNMARESRDAALRAQQCMTDAGQRYIDDYIVTTAVRAETLFDGVYAQVDALAGPMQTLIDNPEASTGIAAAVADEGYFADRLHYDAAGDWAQNRTGAPSVVSVWSYLLGPDHMPRPEVWDVIKRSAIFDLITPGVLDSGPDKLQVYYLGPKDVPIFRTAPWRPQAETFDRLYPGHNTHNFWDFFFPGLYEGWVAWANDSSKRPVADDLTATVPYVDAITGDAIVSYVRPLWSKDRTGVEGLVGMDVTLDQIADLIDSVRLGDSGFAFMAMSNGNVVAVDPDHQELLGLKLDSAGNTSGVAGLERSLSSSTQPAIAALQLPTDDTTVTAHIELGLDGRQVPYLVALRRLKPINLWHSDGTISAESFVLAFLVPESEMFAAWAE